MIYSSERPVFDLFSRAADAGTPESLVLAGSSDESGRREVFVQSYPDLGRFRRQISTSGGKEPHWTRGGRELVYRHADSMFAASVVPTSGETGRPAFLFAGSFLGSLNGGGYDVQPDGGRFLMIKVPPESAPRRIDLVLNWFEELKRAGQ